MSLVPSGTPRRVQATENQLVINWFFLHLLVCFLVLFGFKVCLYTGYLNSKTVIGNSPTDAKALMVQSPLHDLSWLLEGTFDNLSDDDIESRAALDIKFFAIPETIYSQEDEFRNLYDYVEKHRKSATKDVVTIKQSEVILKLVERSSRVAQGSMMKKEMGDNGSLKNSMMIALLKEIKDGNLHFAMAAAVSVKPRLARVAPHLKEAEKRMFSTVWRMQG